MMSDLVRSEQELELMRESGKITAKVLKAVIEKVAPGVNLLDLEKEAEIRLQELGAQASFKTVQGYGFCTCLNINEEIVHGVPRDIKLKEGDILKIDLGALYKGWHTDSAWTVAVGESQNLGDNIQNFLEAGEKAMWAGIKEACAGNRVGDISAAIQEVIEGAGLTVVSSLTGHGVGRKPHEAPQIPGIGKKGTGMKLCLGMTLAIEAIYTTGEDKTFTLDDNWTISGEKGSLAGLFEMSVVVGKNGAEVLTDWRNL